MNIQIFGTKKCNDTKKAERFFKERGIKYQFIDMKEKGMSKGEFTSVAQANGGIENMINWEGKDQDTLALIKYIADEDKLEKILENPSVMVRKTVSCTRWVSQEQFLIRIVVATMMKAGWMRFVQKIEMMKNRRRL